MTISDELEAKILRYFHVEKWRVGTISRRLKIHHTVVKRVLLQSGSAKANAVMRPSRLDPFLPFILDALAKYPKLTASRLYHMVVERGYTGVSITSVILFLCIDHYLQLRLILDLEHYQENRLKQTGVILVILISAKPSAL